MRAALCFLLWTTYLLLATSEVKLPGLRAATELRGWIDRPRGSMSLTVVRGFYSCEGTKFHLPQLDAQRRKTTEI